MHFHVLAVRQIFQIMVKSHKKAQNELLIDEEPGWGYSCLTMIDPQTVGILYESSVAQMTFQAIPLRDIIKQEEE